jgi:hypothetical protein
MNAIEQARYNYLPIDGIRILFVAEAPPEDPHRFFDKVEEHDCLFLALMHLLYMDAEAAVASELRRRKREFLHRLQADGYFLEDAREAKAYTRRPGEKTAPFE